MNPSNMNSYTFLQQSVCLRTYCVSHTLLEYAEPSSVKGYHPCVTSTDEHTSKYVREKHKYTCVYILYFTLSYLCPACPTDWVFQRTVLRCYAASQSSPRVCILNPSAPLLKLTVRTVRIVSNFRINCFSQQYSTLATLIDGSTYHPTGCCVCVFSIKIIRAKLECAIIFSF